MLDKLNLLSDYKFYFQVTINAYGIDIERNVASTEAIIKSFRSLSDMIGKERAIWRYDPIILTDQIGIEYHRRNFESLSSMLEGYTNRCIISFVDIYKKTERNMNDLSENIIDTPKMIRIAEMISGIAKNYNIKIETCSETIDLSSVGIEHARCIDDRLISKIIGQEINVNKDKNQRAICGCASSIDIGAYNSCKHGCRYCYANFSDNRVTSNVLNHDLILLCSSVI
jgi:hypothetical protein